MRTEINCAIPCQAIKNSLVAAHFISVHWQTVSVGKRANFDITNRLNCSGNGWMDTIRWGVDYCFRRQISLPWFMLAVSRGTAISGTSPHLPDPIGSDDAHCLASFMRRLRGHLWSVQPYVRSVGLACEAEGTWSENRPEAIRNTSLWVLLEKTDISRSSSRP